MESIFQEIPWLKKFNSDTKWDKVVISRYAGDPATKTVEDPLFLENINLQDAGTTFTVEAG